MSPLARVTAGVGNDGATEGAWRGKLLGTYSHGPALARNPALADLLLRWATGAHQLPPLDDTWSDRLRYERRAAVAAARPGHDRAPSGGCSGSRRRAGSPCCCCCSPGSA